MSKDLNLRLKELNAVPPKVKISIRSDADPCSSIDSACASSPVLKEELTPEEANARHRKLGLMIPDNFVRGKYTRCERSNNLYHQ